MRRPTFRRSPPAAGPTAGEAGWTFLETLIVMGIVLVLTSSVGLLGFRYIDRAKVVAARTTVANIATAVEAYYLDCGQYPTTEQGLSALWTKPVLDPLPQHWSGPYVDRRIGADPWGKPYRYLRPGPEGLPYAIVSYGSDGSEGGAGNAEDIASWHE